MEIHLKGEKVILIFIGNRLLKEVVELINFLI